MHLTLQRYGYQVIAANGGAQALAVYNSFGNKISLVITDVSMQEMDGFALITALKEINPSVLIIASSGMELPAHASSKSNNILFLQKPYSVGRLLDTVHQMLRKLG